MNVEKYFVKDMGDIYEWFIDIISNPLTGWSLIYQHLGVMFKKDEDNLAIK